MPELDVPRSELHATALQVADRNSLHLIAVDSHVRDARNVLDEKPFWLTFGDDAARLLQHSPAVHDGSVFRVRSMSIGHRETLTRRARHDSIEPARDAGKLTNVTASDEVRGLDDYETCARECTVEEADAGEEGEDELVHGFRMPMPDLADVIGF